MYQNKNDSKLTGTENEYVYLQQIFSLTHIFFCISKVASRNDFSHMMTFTTLNSFKNFGGNNVIVLYPFVTKPMLIKMNITANSFNKRTDAWDNILWVPVTWVRKTLSEGLHTHNSKPRQVKGSSNILRRPL